MENFGLLHLILGLALTVLLVFVIRLFGAWMFRINEVINILEEIRDGKKKY